jgi:pre-mRNA-processing factor 40
MNGTFEDAVPLMEKLPEWQALDDDGRRSAFSKFVKRQKVRVGRCWWELD